MQTSEHAINDYSASMNSPARTIRIDHVLREKIASGKKLTLGDLGDLQQDVVDIIAQRMLPKIVEIIKVDGMQGMSEADKFSVEEMLDILNGWDGSFDKKSVAATVYNRWNI